MRWAWFTVFTTQSCTCEQQEKFKLAAHSSQVNTFSDLLLQQVKGWLHAMV
jgi:hypothetical protein